MRRSLPIVVAVLGCSPALAQPEGREEALASLVAAERAFARASVERGLREAFLDFFAEDGIGFQPLPVKVKAKLLAQPAPSGPPPTVVTWEPELADVARAGDLGYTTGPAVIEDRSPARRNARRGTYFTVWKKQADGSWKAVLDAGTDGPAGGGGRQAVYRAAAAPLWRIPEAAPDPAAARASLLDADRSLLAAARTGGLTAATLAAVAEDARFHRWGSDPIVGRQAIREWLLAERRSPDWEPTAADVSRSGDLGYTYGRYRLQASAAASTERGYYARVWRRDESGAWKLVLDTLSPVPQGDGEDAFVNAGYAYLQQGQVKDAIEVFERMAAVHPRSANAHDCLADAHLAAGDRALALEHARRALDMLEQDPNPDAAFKARVRQSATAKLAGAVGR